LTAPWHYDPKKEMWFYGIFIARFLIVIILVAFYFLKNHTDERWERKGWTTFLF
jgi:NADH:ubiquinone oxidoreductase subunit 3 (subunit A)